MKFGAMNISLLATTTTAPVSQLLGNQLFGVTMAVLVYSTIVGAHAFKVLDDQRSLRSIRPSVVLVAVAGAVISGVAAHLMLPIWPDLPGVTTAQWIMCGTLIGCLVGAAVNFFISRDWVQGLKTVVLGVVLVGIFWTLPYAQLVTDMTALHQ